MWWRSLTALFLILHGIVFAFLDPESWLFEDGRGVYVALGVLGAACLTLGGGLLVAHRTAWRLPIAAGAAISLAQLLLFFEPGLLVGVAIDVAILIVVAWTYVSGAPAPAYSSPRGSQGKVVSQ